MDKFKFKLQKMAGVELLSTQQMKEVKGGNKPPGGCGGLLNPCGSIYDPSCCDGFTCQANDFGGYEYQACQSGSGGV